MEVAPSELAEQAFPPAAADPVTGEAQAAVMALEVALSDLDLGVLPDGAQARPWPAVAAEMNRLNTQLRPTCDYAAEGVVLPGLLDELHALYVTDPDHRADILRALGDCYQTAGVMLKNLGVRGLPTLAAFRARQVAEELDDPAWLGLAAWLRGYTLGGTEGRPRMLQLSVRGVLRWAIGPFTREHQHSALRLSTQAYKGLGVWDYQGNTSQPIRNPLCVRSNEVNADGTGAGSRCLACKLVGRGRDAIGPPMLRMSQHVAQAGGHETSQARTRQHTARAADPSKMPPRNGGDRSAWPATWCLAISIPPLA